MKSLVYEINFSLDTAEESMHKLEEVTKETTKNERLREKRNLKSE